MTTLANLADRAQLALNDATAATWAQATVEQWVIEALRDYSTMFPLIYRTSINCATNDHDYQLPQTVTNIISVEYPDGEDPPKFLKRLDRRHPNFWGSPLYYDYIVLNDATFSGSGSGFTSSTLWISAHATTGETIEVVYHGTHDLTLTSGESITIPFEHEHILILFIVWKAHAERVATEAQNPDTTIRMLHQMKLTAEAAERSYRAACRDAQQRAGAGGWTGPWDVDGDDRIY